MMKFQVDDQGALKAALEAMCSALERAAVSENAVFDCKLVANELLVNALRHGGGHALFSAEMGVDEIVIRVRSGRPFCPPRAPVCSDVDAECGRGLFLVDALSVSRSYSEEEGISVIVRIR